MVEAQHNDKEAKDESSAGDHTLGLNSTERIKGDEGGEGSREGGDRLYIVSEHLGTSERGSQYVLQGCGEGRRSPSPAPPACGEVGEVFEGRFKQTADLK